MYIVYQTPLPFKAKVQSSLPNQDFMEIDAMDMVYGYARDAVVLVKLARPRSYLDIEE
mgnify:CR=1 FL=1